MLNEESVEVTEMLERIRTGDPDSVNELIEQLYDQFCRRARGQLRFERQRHSILTGDLVHESLDRLLRNGEFSKATNRHELYRAFARAMRQVLVDRYRQRNADKRGGNWMRHELDDLSDEICRRCGGKLLDLYEALTTLAQELQREAAVLEMRFFGGNSSPEIAEALGVSLRTVERDSRFALSWLRRFLG